jgi:hypothetical protein
MLLAVVEVQEKQHNFYRAIMKVLVQVVMDCHHLFHRVRRLLVLAVAQVLGNKELEMVLLVLVVGVL